MARDPLFTDDAAADAAYRNVREAARDWSKQARQHCEILWERFEHLADSEFRKEIREHFDARYWEMYLTVSLMDQGYDVICPKPGPDVGIEFEGRRI